MSRCRSCGAPIIWARTLRGKAIPLDAEPDHYGGNVILHQDGTATVVSGMGGWQQPSDGALHQSHFARCYDTIEKERP